MSVVVGNDVSEGDELRRVKLEKEEEVSIIKSDVSTESSSSIGQPDDDSDEGDEDEVQSTLSSLASLEDSLPIKRGLSKFYGGKSKSFGNLGEVKSLKEIGKADNPFNKRRRTLMAYNLMFNKDDKNLNEISNNNNKSTKNKNKSGLFYAHSNAISMPLLPLAEDDDDGDSNIYGSSSSFMGSRGFHRFEEKRSYPSIDDTDHHTSVNVVSSSSRLDVYSSVK